MAVSQDADRRSANGPFPTAIAIGIPALCAILAFGIRLWNLGDKSLWLDEALSWRAAHMPFSAMTDFAAGHADTPLYYAFLTYWVKVAGNSEVALRLPSALAGALSVLVLAWAAWRVGGALLGAVAGVLLAVNAAAVTFSQEARMYPLTGLLALVASVLLASFVVRPNLLRLAGYAIVSIGLVYAHYSGWVLLTLHGALFVTYGTQRMWERRDPRVLAGGIAAFAVIGIAYIPWYHHFFHAAGTGVPIPTPTWAVTTGVLRSALSLDRAGRYWPYIAVPLLLLGLAGIARRLKDPMVVCVAALAIVPVAMLDISIVRTPVFNLKQISPYIPGLCFVVAVGIVEAGALLRRIRLPARGAASVSIALAAFVALIAFQGTRDWYGTPPGEDWRSAAAHVDAQQPVYIFPWWSGVGVNYYLGGADVARPLPASVVPSVLDDGYLPITSAHAGEQSTLILTHARGPESDAILKSLRPYFSITEPAGYWGLHVYSLRRNTAAEHNVDLTDNVAGGDNAGWTTTADGDLRTGDNASFKLRSGGGSTPFTLHVEYLDAGSDSFGVTSAPAQGDAADVATIPRTDSNTWRTADVPIDDRKASDKTFAITRGVTIRTLEMRRYVLEGADVLRSGASDFRQWFLRGDGYLETIGANVCVWPSAHVDPAATPTMTIDITYKDAGRWVSSTTTVPAVDGLSCPIAMPASLVVKRLVVRGTP